MNQDPMAIKDIVSLLKANGHEDITAKKVRDDIEAGAPVNPDGTMDLLEYGAWLARFL